MKINNMLKQKKKKKRTVVEKGNGRERKSQKLAFSFFILSELSRAEEKTEENKMEIEKNEKYFDDTNSATYK